MSVKMDIDKKQMEITETRLAQTLADPSRMTVVTSTSEEDQNKIPTIFMAILLIIMIILVICLCCYIRKQKRQRRSEQEVLAKQKKASIENSESDNEAVKNVAIVGGPKLSVYEQQQPDSDRVSKQ